MKKTVKPEKFFNTHLSERPKPAKFPAQAVVEMCGNYNVHPFTDTFPKYSDVDALRGSMILAGQQQPVVFWQDSENLDAAPSLVDGRHRIRAWGGEVARLKYVIYTCKERTIIEFIMATNFHHRHLEPGQIAMIEAEAKKRIGILQKRGPLPNSLLAGKQTPVPTETSRSSRTSAGNVVAHGPLPNSLLAGKQTPVPTETSRSSRTSAGNVVAHGSDKLREAATDGKIGVKPAEQAAKKLTAEAQDEFVDRVNSGEKPAAAIQQLLGDETKRKPEAAAPPKKPDLVYTVTVPNFVGDNTRHLVALTEILAEKFYGPEFSIKLRA